MNIEQDVTDYLQKTAVFFLKLAWFFATFTFVISKDMVPLNCACSDQLACIWTIVKLKIVRGVPQQFWGIAMMQMTSWWVTWFVYVAWLVELPTVGKYLFTWCLWCAPPAETLITRLKAAAQLLWECPVSAMECMQSVNQNEMKCHLVDSMVWKILCWCYLNLPKT